MLVHVTFTLFTSYLFLMFIIYLKCPIQHEQISYRCYMYLSLLTILLFDHIVQSKS